MYKLYLKLHIVALLAFTLHLLITQTKSTTLKNGNVTLNLDISNTDGIFLELIEGGEKKLTGRIGMGIKFQTITGTESTETTFSAYEADIQFSVTQADDCGFNIYFNSRNKSTTFQDCFSLNSDFDWFMGREGNTNDWPTQNSVFLDEANVLSSDFPVSEPYWLNSKGAYIFVNETTPLFFDLNNEFIRSLCLIGRLEEPYSNSKLIPALNYTISAKENARIAHLHAVNTYLGRPTEIPHAEMVKFPTWTTSVKYGSNLNDTLLYEFAQSVQTQKFRGQIEVEDGWEECYGSFRFKKNDFSGIDQTIMRVHSLALNIIVGIHPFVNVECETVAKEGVENDYFVKGSDESLISWWNGKSAYLIDFTNTKAQNWFFERISWLILKQSPLDGFQFIAGEPSWAPKNASYTVSYNTPNVISNYFSSLSNATAYGSYQSGWRTQNVPAFVTIPDKESNWGQENGLKSLVINLMQLNLAGYTMVSAGIIGGKSEEPPSPELFIRWLQAVTLTPVLKFGHLPWEIFSSDFDVMKIAKKHIDLHNKYSKKLLNVMKKSMTMGLPVNAPVWWIEPGNAKLFSITDQYMLGEDFLVAPVLTEGAVSRDIYLPPGIWEDGNNRGTLHEGNRILKAFPAPIDTLPFFLLRKDL